MTAVDLHITPGFPLPAEPGAQTALSLLSPLFAAGWAALTEVVPQASLDPLFPGAHGLAVEVINNLVDAARMRGDEPPDLLRWFSLECPPELLEAALPLVQGLPLVDWAGERPLPVPAGQRDGHLSWGTNPDAVRSLQLQRSPYGVDALHAWRVAGGTGSGVNVADIENGWWLGHDELIAAPVTPASVFGAPPQDAESHGTSVAGIIVGSDNGVGTLGIAPDARLFLVTPLRETGQTSVAAAILVAAATVGIGGVVLLEVAFQLPQSVTADLLVETNWPVHVAIRWATLVCGVSVVEAGGNGAVDLDSPPALGPEARAFDLTLPNRQDSGAIVVGACVLDEGMTAWTPAEFSLRGGRVDCFAGGHAVRAPSRAGRSAYLLFGGTSAASAVIAGAVAAIQGAARADTGFPLTPDEVRNLLRNRSLGTGTSPGFGGVGTMPDLRRIARANGWHRVLPVAAVAVSNDSALLVYLDDDDRLVRRHFSFFTGWGRPLPQPEDDLDLWPAQPVALFRAEGEPLDRLVYSVLANGPFGVHHLWWDSLDQSGGAYAAGLATSDPASSLPVAAGTSVAAVRAAEHSLVLCGINRDARLVAMVGDPTVHLSHGVSRPLVLDQVARFRRLDGPAIASAGDGTVDVVAVEDGGSLIWFHGTVLATTGTGWSPGITEPTFTRLQPGARPALLALDGTLLTAAVGDEGWLRTVTISPAAGTTPSAYSEVEVVDTGVTLATNGPLATVRLTRQAVDVVLVFGIDTEGSLRCASRRAAGGAWSLLTQLPAGTALSPLGGVTAVVSPDLGVMVFAVGTDGRIRWTQTRTGTDWGAMRPLPDP